jgi:para-nitrobenzyl esterase
MVDYWSRFVTTGAPDAVGQPDWPALDGAADPARMSLQADGSRLTDDFGDEHQCPFWAGLKG